MQYILMNKRNFTDAQYPSFTCSVLNYILPSCNIFLNPSILRSNILPPPHPSHTQSFPYHSHHLLHSRETSFLFYHILPTTYPHNSHFSSFDQYLNLFPTPFLNSFYLTMSSGFPFLADIQRINELPRHLEQVLD